MRQMQPVLWTKGVLLSPQHLQTQDRFLEDQMEFRLSSLSQWRWGFSRLELDRESLGGGVVALTEATGIMPDGLPFDVPEADAAPPPRPLDEIWIGDRKALVVHLAVPERRAGAANVAMGHAGSARYGAEIVLRRDENTGGSEKPIQVARKNFRIAAESENLEGHSTLRLARIVRAESGEFEVDPSFVPPVLDIGASPHLLSLARRLVELLSARSSALAGSRRQRSQDLADFGVVDVANFWLLYTVNTHLPLFRHLLESRRGHPADLYEAMLALAGALTTFSTDLHPRDLPLYDHHDPQPCFDELDARVRELLGTVVPTHHVSLPLRPTEPSIHATALEQERYLAPTDAFLAVRAGLDAAELVSRVPQLVKVSSGDRIEVLIRQALAGLGLRHVSEPPGALPVKLDYQYFRLDRSGPEWEAIRQARNVAVYLPSDLPDPEAELVLLLPKEPKEPTKKKKRP
jgi:type VI secretion system protein ImpJ